MERAASQNWTVAVKQEHGDTLIWSNFIYSTFIKTRISKVLCEKAFESEKKRFPTAMGGKIPLTGRNLQQDPASGKGGGKASFGKHQVCSCGPFVLRLVYATNLIQNKNNRRA